MARIYAIANNKGGVEKTTNTLQIAYDLARRGYKTLIVSMDPQCNIDYTLTGDIEDGSEVDLSEFEQEFDAFDDQYDWEDVPDLKISEETNEDEAVVPGHGVPTLYDVVIGINGDQKKKRSVREVIIPLPQQENLFLAKGSVELANMDINLSSIHGRENILKRALDPIQGEYDFILIDTPPTLGLAPVNAFVAAGSRPDRTNGLIISISPQAYSVLGIRTMLGAIYRMRDQLEVPLPIFGVVCANVKRTKNARRRMKQVRDFFKKAVFLTTIPQSEKVEEAADRQTALSKYAPGTPGAIAYRALVDEILKRAGLSSEKLEKETVHA